MQQIIRRNKRKEQSEFLGLWFFKKGYFSEHILKTGLSGRGFGKGFRKDQEMETKQNRHH